MADNNTFSEIVEDFKTMVLERFGSPFLFSFTVSWVIINYPVFFILFSNSKIHYRLILLKWYFDPSDFVFYHSHIWAGPLLITSLYVFGYPYLNRRILRFVIDRKMDELRDRSEKEKVALFTYEAIERLKQRHAREIQRYSDEIENHIERESQLTSTIKDLNAVIATNQKELIELNELNIQLKEMQNDKDNNTYIVQDDEIKIGTHISQVSHEAFELSPAEQAVLLSIGKNETAESAFTWEKMLFTSELSPVRVRFAIDKLYEKAIVLRDHDSDGDTYYELTAKGREYFEALDIPF